MARRWPSLVWLSLLLALTVFPLLEPPVFYMRLLGTVLLFVRLGWPPYAALLPAGLIAAAFAVLVGYPTLRLRGPYFAIATLALGFVTQLAVGNLPFTGGGEGIVVRGGMPFTRYALEQAF